MPLPNLNWTELRAKAVDLEQGCELGRHSSVQGASGRERDRQAAAVQWPSEAEWSQMTPRQQWTWAKNKEVPASD